MQCRWDYIVVTAANDAQQISYERQLLLRRKLGLLANRPEIRIVSAPSEECSGGGASMLQGLMAILPDQPQVQGITEHWDPGLWQECLGDLNILVLLASEPTLGLPAYSAVGLAFCPLPGGDQTGLGRSLLEDQLAALVAGPALAGRSRGQVLVVPMDVLPRVEDGFCAEETVGVVGFGCDVASGHSSQRGGFLLGQGGALRRYLPGPDLRRQLTGSPGDPGDSLLLDTGVLQFDAATAATLLNTVGIRTGPEGRLIWSGEMARAVRVHGLDLQREICSAMGSEVSLPDYLTSARDRGSTCPAPHLTRLFEALANTSSHVRRLPSERLRNFGSTSELMAYGLRPTCGERGLQNVGGPLIVNTIATEEQNVTGQASWIEGCRISTGVHLEGGNILIGADVIEPLCLPGGMCLDVLPGRDRWERGVWFVRCYGIRDDFAAPVTGQCLFCGLPMGEWLHRMGASMSDILTHPDRREQATLWHAQLFPAVRTNAEHSRWTWMFRPQSARRDWTRAWQRADRYSMDEMARLVDFEAFHSRRQWIRLSELSHALRQGYGPGDAGPGEGISRIPGHDGRNGVLRVRT